MAIVFRRTLLQSLVILTLSALALLAPTPALAQKDAAPLTGPQLEQLVAPIALYPDSLLSQVLMASTYPLEVVEAARWSRSNQSVTSQALEDAMQKQTWDPSVKALTSVPQTLEMMNDKLPWTQRLGDAFLAQQDDVLSAVQRLRARADASGFLKSNENQRVTKAAAPPSGAGAPSGTTTPGAPSSVAAGPAPAPVYTIEPVVPGEYALPIYDPTVVYGAWPYPDYPPDYWSPVGYAGYGPLGFAAAALTGAAIWGGVDWWRNRVNVNVNNFNRFNRTNIANGNWAHNPAHRGNVPYRDRGVAQRFGDPSRAANRDAFRGKADAGRRDMAGQNARTKAGAAAAGAGAGAAAGKGAANRAAGNKQAGQGQRAAGAKQAGQGQRAAGAKQAANTKKAGAQKSAGAKQGAGSKQTARASQGARPKQTAARSSAARPTAARAPSAARAQAGPRGGGMQRANVNLPRGGGGMRAGGGGRGGGRRR